MTEELIDLTRAPKAILDLRRWLEISGFQVLQSKKTDQFNQNAVFAYWRMRVRINSTRGDWSIGIALVGMHFYCGANAWKAWSAGTSIDTDEPDVETDVEYIVNCWRSDVESIADIGLVEQQLRELRNEWSSTILDLPFDWVPPDPDPWDQEIV